MTALRLAVCDDELLIRMWLQEHLAEEGFDVSTYATGPDLLNALRAEPVDLVLLDLRLPSMSGLEVLDEIRGMDPSVAVIMISAHGEVETAVDAVRKGAYHFLEKPIELPELKLLIDQALESSRLVREVNRHREGNRWRFADVTMVGRSRALRDIAETVTRLALRGSPANVLIRGESGTGKDVVARAIHARGPRRRQFFISVNCTTLPDSLVETELFGHVAGAFTDARESKIGLFALADSGTLFLDEVGDMPRVAQSKLLQVLEEGSIRPVGGTRSIPIDVHVIAATNRDLEAAVEEGSFREDLYYRLNVVPIYVPPLRERPEDIAPLTLHFVSQMCAEIRLEERHVMPDAMRALERHDWPGNARQLRNVVERILLLHDEKNIELGILPPDVRGSATTHPENVVHLPPDGVDLSGVERELIQQALERANGNKSQAARLLGLTRDTLRYRLEKHGMGSR